MPIHNPWHPWLIELLIVGAECLHPVAITKSKQPNHTAECSSLVQTTISRFMREEFARGHCPVSLTAPATLLKSSPNPSIQHSPITSTQKGGSPPESSTLPSSSSRLPSANSLVPTNSRLLAVPSSPPTFPSVQWSYLSMQHYSASFEQPHNLIRSPIYAVGST